MFPELYCSLYRVLQILAAIRCNQSECKLWISSCFKALVRTDICKPAELGILCIPTITHFVLWKVQRLKIIKALISLAITRDFVCVLYCMPNQKSYLGAILCCRFKSRLMLLSSGFTDRWILYSRELHISNFEKRSSNSAKPRSINFGIEDNMQGNLRIHLGSSFPITLLANLCSFYSLLFWTCSQSCEGEHESATHQVFCCLFKWHSP